VIGAVASLNAGSSSIKFALYDGLDLALLGRGQVDGLGSSPRLAIAGEPPRALDGADHRAAIAAALAWIDARLGERPLAAIGHRVVHGGDRGGPARIDAALLAELDALTPFAPLHQPHNLAAIRAAADARPGLAQIACFDTSFHRTMADLTTRFPLPRAWHDRGVRRYGFHGLSYEWIAARLAECDPALGRGRVIVAHLGAGASLCALAAGRSVDTSMGLTALDGLMMATRTGAIDPGVLLHLLDRGLDAAALARLLYHESGLLGVSGRSADMRVLLASDAPEAAEAIALFCARAASGIAALIPALGGLDGLVFTGGIGEHAAPVRAAICARLGWLGLTLDAAANAAHAATISAPGSAVAVRVIATDEERMIAGHARALAALPAG
jgi:acetate kinase